MLLAHLDHTHPIEVLVQFEFAYPLCIQHFCIVKDEYYMIPRYLCLVLDQFLKFSYLLLFVQFEPMLLLGLQSGDNDSVFSHLDHL